MEEQSNEALWYVVHTYSGYENKVAGDLQTLVKNRHLEDLICDIRIPTETVLEPVPVKKTTRKKKTSDYDDFSDVYSKISESISLSRIRYSLQRSCTVSFLRTSARSLAW